MIGENTLAVAFASFRERPHTVQYHNAAMATSALRRTQRRTPAPPATNKPLQGFVYFWHLLLAAREAALQNSSPQCWHACSPATPSQQVRASSSGRGHAKELSVSHHMGHPRLRVGRVAAALRARCPHQLVPACWHQLMRAPSPQCGSHAPNAQPWVAHVVRNRELFRVATAAA